MGLTATDEPEDIRDPSSPPVVRFEVFCAQTEPRLRRALVSAFGPDLGRDAAAAALAWAWEHFDQVEAMDNPAGYLWRVGRSSVRTELRRQRWNVGASLGDDRGARPHLVPDDAMAFEPRLHGSLAALSARQRTAVLLVHGHGYSLAETADAMGCRIRTLRHHLDRGLTKLRRDLGVTIDG